MWGRKSSLKLFRHDVGCAGEDTTALIEYLPYHEIHFFSKASMKRAWVDSSL